MRNVLLPLLLAGCGDMDHTGHGDTASIDELREVSTASYTVAYTPSPDPIPLNDYFSLVVTVQDSGGAVTDAEVVVDANMPHHGHGMTVTPTVSDDGAGTWTAEGLLFPMSGIWQITVDITRDGSTEQATFDVLLEAE